MTLTEKVAYLKGLVEGIGVDETTNNGKIMKAVLDVLDDMAFTVSDLEDSTSELYEEVKCPNCDEEICIDGSVLDKGEIQCPNCGETLTFEFDDECDCCCEDDCDCGCDK